MSARQPSAHVAVIGGASAGLMADKVGMDIAVPNRWKRCSRAVASLQRDKQLSLARQPANSFAHDDPFDALVRDQPHDSDRDI